VQVTSVFVVAVLLFALVLGAIGIGGGIYETLIVDRVWPDNLAIIQPRRGGIRRGVFWGPVHTLYELALLVSAWMVWGDTYTRRWIVVALLAHFVARVWSFAYFIPNALRFEKLDNLTEDQARLARRWTRLSRYRPVFGALSIAALCAVILHFGVR
jgi:hypothetical protein